MTDIILHNYEASPFAKKIRAILGLKKANWSSVEIPRIMPKPDVVALTGGYRRTPIMQIGADIYCDTALISQKLDQIFPENTLYPSEYLAAAKTMAYWADNILFQHTVPVAFQKEVMMQTFGGNVEMMKAFVSDRADMSKDSPRRRILPEEAHLMFDTFLEDLNTQLSDERKFLLGEKPCIADFSVYHALWFIKSKPIITEKFVGHHHLLRWMDTIDELGEGNVTIISSSDAIAIAKQSSSKQQLAKNLLSEFTLGDDVEIMPGDYGFDPVKGKLVYSDENEFAISRQDDRAGDLVVHFPRLGYDIRLAE
ncbi:MAG: glutathione S-transferase family protein [Cellvibrionaceae bacterium]